MPSFLLILLSPVSGRIWDKRPFHLLFKSQSSQVRPVPVEDGMEERGRGNNVLVPRAGNSIDSESHQ